MTVTTTKSAYWAGVRDGLPFIVMVVPFALLFGVVGIEAGLSMAQTMSFSVLVIAGASQFAALQLMLENAAIGFVLLAALAVNLRMAMYSAALAPHLGAAPFWQRALVGYLNFDQSYMASIAKYEDNPQMTLPAKVAYFLGVALVISPLWCVFTYIGARLGATVPADIEIAFILPIAFLSMVAPMLKSLAHVAAAFVSLIVAISLAGLPAGSGLLIAAVCAMLTGVVVETWMERAKR
jgi:predicted branched-subunit amino acid permease|tara:strand:- start:834 stop:1544 length:711 start_codon:yes stop_codon:yes gene_type:complete